jgi:hypothetical protein
VSNFDEDNCLKSDDMDNKRERGTQFYSKLQKELMMHLCLKCFQLHDVTCAYCKLKTTQLPYKTE